MANIGELPLRSLAEGPHPSSESAKKLKLPLCLRPPNKVAKENFFTVVFVQVVKKSALDVQNLLFFSFTNWAHCCRRHRRLLGCSQDLSMCVNGYESEHGFTKNACHLFTRYIHECYQ